MLKECDDLLRVLPSDGWWRDSNSGSLAGRACHTHIVISQVPVTMQISDGDLTGDPGLYASNGLLGDSSAVEPGPSPGSSPGPFAKM